MIRFIFDTVPIFAIICTVSKPGNFETDPGSDLIEVRSDFQI